MKNLLSAFLAIAGLSIMLTACKQDPQSANGPNLPLSASYHADWSHEPAFVQQAIAVQDRHTDELRNIPGVIGTGTALDEKDHGKAVVVVYTDRAGVAGIPSSLEGIATHIRNVGKVCASSGTYKAAYRNSLPCGVAVGRDTFFSGNCHYGSIGALVNSSRTSGGKGTYGYRITVYGGQYTWPSGTSPVYMLSCNHVFAMPVNTGYNGAVIDQPIECAAWAAGKLHAWDTLVADSTYTTCTSHPTRCTTHYVHRNYYDAALAECNPSLTSTTPNWTPAMMTGSADTLITDTVHGPSVSYTPTNSPAAPSLGMHIKKTGARTGYTASTIYAINVTITCSYSPTNVAYTFVDQFEVMDSSFCRHGDSGSMTVVDDAGYSDNNAPVGLFFCLSINESGPCFYNRMDHIASDFGLTFVQSSF